MMNHTPYKLPNRSPDKSSDPLKIPDGKEVNLFQQWAGVVYMRKKRFTDKVEHYFCDLHNTLYFYKVANDIGIIGSLIATDTSENRANVINNLDCAVESLAAALKRKPSQTATNKLVALQRFFLENQTTKAQAQVQPLPLTRAREFMQIIADLVAIVEPLYRDAMKDLQDVIDVLRFFQHPAWMEMYVNMTYRHEIVLRTAEKNTTDDSFIKGFVTQVDDALDQFWAPAHYAKATAHMRAGQYYLESLPDLLGELTKLEHNCDAISKKRMGQLQSDIREKISTTKENATTQFLDAIYHSQIALQTCGLCHPATAFTYDPSSSILQASSLMPEEIEESVVNYLRTYLSQGPSLEEHLSTELKNQIEETFLGPGKKPLEKRIPELLHFCIGGIVLFPHNAQNIKTAIMAYIKKQVLPEECSEFEKLFSLFRGKKLENPGGEDLATNTEREKEALAAYTQNAVRMLDIFTQEAVATKNTKALMQLSALCLQLHHNHVQAIAMGLQKNESRNYGGFTLHPRSIQKAQQKANLYLFKKYGVNKHTTEAEVDCGLAEDQKYTPEAGGVLSQSNAARLFAKNFRKRPAAASAKTASRQATR